MPLDPSFVGRSYPPGPPYLVSAAKIGEFANAIGDHNPLYTVADAARAAGYPDVVAPPTFATVINIQAIERVVLDPELGGDYRRMVHADQSFTYHRRIVAGDRLVLTAHIDDIRSRAGHDMLTVRGEIGSVDGEPVITTLATLVFRGGDE